MRRHGLLGWAILIAASLLIYSRERLVQRPLADPAPGMPVFMSESWTQSQSLLIIGLLFGLVGAGLVLIDAHRNP